MTFEWITQPLMYYALLAVGIALCLYLFVAVQREILAWKKEQGREMERLRAMVNRLEATLGDLRRELKSTAEGVGMMIPPPPAASGMNMNKRTQVLRMARRGDQPEQIAAALRLPQSEVDLLLKVQRSVIETGSLHALDVRVAGKDNVPAPDPMAAE